MNNKLQLTILRFWIWSRCGLIFVYLPNSRGKREMEKQPKCFQQVDFLFLWISKWYLQWVRKAKAKESCSMYKDRNIKALSITTYRTSHAMWFSLWCEDQNINKIKRHTNLHMAGKIWFDVGIQEPMPIHTIFRAFSTFRFLAALPFNWKR